MFSIVSELVVFVVVFLMFREIKNLIYEACSLHGSCTQSVDVGSIFVKQL